MPPLFIGIVPNVKLLLLTDNGALTLCIKSASSAYSKAVPPLFTFIILPAVPIEERPFNDITSPFLSNGNDTVILSVVSSAHTNPLLELFIFNILFAPPKPLISFNEIFTG